MLILPVCLALSFLSPGAAHPARLSSDTIPRRHRDLAERQQGQCEHGAWSCTGQTLKRCVYDKVITVQECGANTYCSATGSLVGCFWNANPGQVPPGGTLIPAGQPLASAAGPAQPSPTVIPPPPPPPPPARVSTGAPNPVVSSALPHSALPPSSASTGAPNPAGTNPVPSVPGPPLPSGTGGSAAPSSNNSVTAGTFSAPHYVVYTDLSFIPEKTVFPTPEQLSGINRFVICFWITEKDGPFDNVLVWKTLPAAERKRILDNYHAAGIALMMSYGGKPVSTDPDPQRPTSSGIDPVKLANDISAFVIEYELDGVDVNYEDLNAMAAGTGEAWVISFQTTLRSRLPSPRYLISHAPLAPWFTTHPTAYPGGGYRAVHKAVGDGIDWYNIQFYNQGTLYTDCQSLFTTSGSKFEGTSIMEIGATVPLNKIVLGKPLAPNKGPAGGYMDFAALGACVKEGQAKQWNGGLMLWEWAPGDVTATAQALSAAKGG